MPKSLLTEKRRGSYQEGEKPSPRCSLASRNQSRRGSPCGRQSPRRMDMLRIAFLHNPAGPMAASLAHWREALRVWCRRDRERAELARMSEAELHDIGVT